MPVYCDYCESVIDREEARTLWEGKDVCLGCLDLVRPIASKPDIRRFITEMSRRGWVYHWDDDPREIQKWKHTYTGEEVDPPTEEQLDAIEDRVFEMQSQRESTKWLWHYTFLLDGDKPFRHQHKPNGDSSCDA